mgnify:CR=1 FL=1
MQGNEGTTTEREEMEENSVEEKKQAEELIEKPEEKEIPEVIGVKDFDPVEFVVDRWKKDEEGCLCSAQYLVRNEGETAGTFTLSNLLYTYAKQSEIAVLPEGEKISDSKSVSFHMELMLENGERIDIIRKVLEKNPEEKGYRVILRPGEELKIQFIGERDDVASKEIQKGNIIVKASGSWEREEEGKVE